MSYILVRTPRDIGLLLREARRRAKLDQAELAERLGVSRKWVVEAERGNPGAALGTVLRALDIVDAKLGAIASDAPSPRAKTAHPEHVVDIDAIIDGARKRRR
jgi:HTH-type transcriptional regulator / antitoxin HipB